MGTFTRSLNTLLALQAWNVTGGGGTPAPGQLAPPTNLRQASATSTSNTMAWDAMPNASGYELRNGSTSVYTGPATSFEDTGLSPSTGYGYTVRALGTGNYSNSGYSGVRNAVTAAIATVPFKALAEGNSLTAPTDGWVGMVQAARAGDTTFTIQNLATAGEAWAQINSDTERSQLVAAKAATGITGVVGWEGINSIQGGGLNGQLDYDAAKSFYDFCTANGMKSVAVIITTSRYKDFNSDFHQAIWTYVQQYNDLQRAGFDSGDLGATVLVDLQSVPVFAGYDGPLNSSFFLDGLHFKQAGYAIVAKMMGRALTALRAGTKAIITWQPSDGGAIVPQPLTLTLAPNATYDAAAKKYAYAGPYDASWQPLGISPQYSSLYAEETFVEIDPHMPDMGGFSIGYNTTEEYQASFAMSAACIVLIDKNRLAGVVVYPLVDSSILGGAEREPAPGTKYRMWRKDFNDGRGLCVFLMELLPGATEWGEVYNFNSVGGTLYVQAKINARSDAALSNAITYGLT